MMLNNVTDKEIKLVRAITSYTPMFDLATNKHNTVALIKPLQSSHKILLSFGL